MVTLFHVLCSDRQLEVIARVTLQTPIQALILVVSCAYHVTLRTL